MSNITYKPTIQVTSEEGLTQKFFQTLPSLKEEETASTKTRMDKTQPMSIGVNGESSDLQLNTASSKKGSMSAISNGDSSDTFRLVSYSEASVEKYDHRKMSDGDDVDLRPDLENSLHPPLPHGRRSSIVEVIIEVDPSKEDLLKDSNIQGTNRKDSHTSSIEHLAPPFDSRFISTAQISLFNNTNDHKVELPEKPISPTLHHKQSQEQYIIVHAESTDEGLSTNDQEQIYTQDQNKLTDNISPPATSTNQESSDDVVINCCEEEKERGSGEEIPPTFLVDASSSNIEPILSPGEKQKIKVLVTTWDERTQVKETPKVDKPKITSQYDKVFRLINKVRNWSTRKEEILHSSSPPVRKSSEDLRAKQIYYKMKSEEIDSPKDGKNKEDVERETSRKESWSIQNQGADKRFFMSNVCSTFDSDKDHPNFGSFQDVPKSELFPPQERYIYLNKKTIPVLFLTGISALWGSLFAWQYTTSEVA